MGRDDAIFSDFSDDDALMTRVGAGDTDALGVLLRRHQGRVLRAAARWLSNDGRGGGGRGAGGLSARLAFGGRVCGAGKFPGVPFANHKKSVLRCTPPDACYPPSRRFARPTDRRFRSARTASDGGGVPGGACRLAGGTGRRFRFKATMRAELPGNRRHSGCPIGTVASRKFWR